MTVFQLFARLPLLAASALAAAAGLLVGAATAQAAPEEFKISLEEPGVYRVAFDDLPWSRPPAAQIPTAAIGLTQMGRPVPIWVEDGGDDRFDPGDWIEFVAEHLAGESSYYSPYTRYNAYLLGFDGGTPERMRLAHSSAAAEATPARPRAVRHLEEDLLMLRLPPRPGGGDELWYWAKLAHNHRQPFSWSLDLDDLDAAPGGEVVVRLGLRGWSRPRGKADPESGDHAIEVSLNGAAVGAGEWNGTDPHLLELPAIPVEQLRSGANELELRVPVRPGTDGPLIDVAMLNWIELDYPMTVDTGSGQVAFERRDPEGAARLELASPDGEQPWVYGRGGWRIAPAPAGSGSQPGSVWSALLPPGEASFVVGTAATLSRPAAISRRRSADLATTDRQADYLMITDGRFREAVERLAELHRSRGLAVVVAEIDEVYDEFGHGVVHPMAVRDFIAHAYHSWRPPAPRFVLLVGDASWDGRNERVIDANYADWPYRPGETDSFAKNVSTPYADEGERNRRGLIPTWSQPTPYGHAASDNRFVTVDGDDSLPDLAIGRLPVVTAQEVEQIVAKTRRYISSPEVGPWRRNALLITNEDLSFQNLSDGLADELSAAGFAPERVYPAAAETSNEHHTGRLVESLSRGQLLVHFLGHGGRYIWRTGPPDLEKNHDLFTLDHVDQIEPSGRLSVVLSLTCYSAPFDHPNADSIGEKLLRADERGAVGVLAASWRNTPAPDWGQILLAELTTPGATVGEAVLAAKRRIGSRIFVETYNFLGDPAVPLALPGAAIAMELDEPGARGLQVRGILGLSDFDGRILVELVDARGGVVRSTLADLDSADFDLELPASAAELAGATAVRAYAWDPTRGVDAVGSIPLPSAAAPEQAVRDGRAETPGSSR